MLKKINPIISPELLKILAEMGHTDEIVICDGNMPVYTVGKNVVRLDGHGVPEILKAVLEYFPLDAKTEKPVTLCDWTGPRPDIWDAYKKIILESEEADKFRNGFNMLKDPEFMGRVRNAYCLVATSEKSLAANIILKKGLL